MYNKYIYICMYIYVQLKPSEAREISIIGHVWMTNNKKRLILFCISRPYIDRCTRTKIGIVITLFRLT